jgi:pyruvate dehydrogenase E2 component (dihydrolipoamide acetyltransferase)/2-oxoisovalerate dehydrogenase E2 component (dihydrolipoyl transacylase)
MDFRLPELGEGVYEAELVSWLVQPGATVKRGQALLEVLTDKATMEVPAPFAGTVEALQVEPGQRVKVGEVVLTYAPASQPTAEPASPASDGRRPQAPAATAVPSNGPARSDLPVKAAPSVRAMARKLGIDLARVPGSGPEGRILIEDLTSTLPERQAAPAAQATRPAAKPAAEYGTPGTRIKLQGLRRRIAEHMVLAKRTIPHYSYVDECDVTELVRLRDALREPCNRAGLKLTYLPFFVKAVVAALKEVPLVNATLDEAAGEIVLHDRYHIGVAVATPAGLVVPVVRDADRKDLFEIAREIDRLSAAAREGKARREDLVGSTFTITSIGGIGGLISTPIVNHPEVGILGIGKVVKRPVYDSAGNIRPADLIYLSLSFDHRVVDGAVGAVFGNCVSRRLQNAAAFLVPDKLGRGV